MAKKDIPALTKLQGDINPQDLVILDTETTGLGEGAELLELSIIQATTGVTLWDTRYKPDWNMSWEYATKIHGITPEDVKDYSRLGSDMAELRRLLKGKVILMYNAPFDTMMFPDRLSSAKDTICMMRAYSDLVQSSKFVSLAKAATAAEHDWSVGPAHSALGDCLATRSVLLHTLEKIKEASDALGEL